MNAKGWYELKISIHGVKTLNVWALWALWALWAPAVVIAVKASDEWK